MTQSFDVAQIDAKAKEKKVTKENYCINIYKFVFSRCAIFITRSAVIHTSN